MFTGIVEEIGTLKKIVWGAHSAVLSIQARHVLSDAAVGDSIAVNGICLTVTSLSPSGFTADVMHETLNRSSLKGAKPGMHVNLERAMAAGGHFGGHIVSGHADGTGIIREIRQDDNAVWFTISTSSKLLRYIVEKGSITIDGISLTVASVTTDGFSVSTIPHTNAVTTLGERKAGDLVNLETDIIGKYVERLLQPMKAQPEWKAGTEMRSAETDSGADLGRGGITKEFLTRYGF